MSTTTTTATPAHQAWSEALKAEDKARSSERRHEFNIDHRIATCRAEIAERLAFIAVLEEKRATEVAYCVRGGCGQVATHLVSHYSVETDQLTQTVAACKHHVPVFLMGHNDTVYARFCGFGAA